MNKKEDQILWLVCKLMRNVSCTDYLTGKEEEYQLDGVRGFLPVYDNIEDAKEASCDGKFAIMRIKTN